MRNCIYRFLNKNNEIIYIGKAKDLKMRLSHHIHLPKECYDERAKIEYTCMYTMDEVDILERYLIAKIKPKYNVDFSNKNIFINLSEFDNLKWINYEDDIENILDDFKHAPSLYKNYIICKDMSFINELKNIDVIRAIILSTYLCKDGFIRCKSRKITKSKLFKIWDLKNSKQSTITYENLISSGVIYLSDGYIKMNDDFELGSNKSVVHSDYIIINSDLIRDAYYGIKNRTHRVFLASPFILIKYANPFDNVIYNDRSFEVSANLKNINKMLKYTSYHSRIKENLSCIEINGKRGIYQDKILDKNVYIINNNIVKYPVYERRSCIG